MGYRDAGSLAWDVLLLAGPPLSGAGRRRVSGLEDEECVMDDCGGDGFVLGIAMGVAAGIK